MAETCMYRQVYRAIQLGLGLFVLESEYVPVAIMWRAPRCDGRWGPSGAPSQRNRQEELQQHPSFSINVSAAPSVISLLLMLLLLLSIQSLLANIGSLHAP